MVADQDPELRAWAVLAIRRCRQDKSLEEFRPWPSSWHCTAATPVGDRLQSVRFVVDPPIPTHKSDPPAARKEAALLALELLLPADVTFWSDRSAAGGTANGGAGAKVHLHRLDRKVEVRAVAGTVCSSLRPSSWSWDRPPCPIDIPSARGVIR